MHNIVDFTTGRARPRRFDAPPADGAEILFFTGVRYEREVEAPAFVPEAMPFPETSDRETATIALMGSDVSLDLAAH